MVFVTAPSKLTRKVTKSLKRRLLAKLPWVNSNNNSTDDNGSVGSVSQHEVVPAVSARRTETDENALNEALEARLMELIANTPAQEDGPITLHVGMATVFIPANPDALIYDTASLSSSSVSSAASFTGLMPKVKTWCQTAQAQV